MHGYWKLPGPNNTLTPKTRDPTSCICGMVPIRITFSNAIMIAIKIFQARFI